MEERGGSCLKGLRPGRRQTRGVNVAEKPGLWKQPDHFGGQRGGNAESDRPQPRNVRRSTLRCAKFAEDNIDPNSIRSWL